MTWTDNRRQGTGGQGANVVAWPRSKRMQIAGGKEQGLRKWVMGQRTQVPGTSIAVNTAHIHTL